MAPRFFDGRLFPLEDIIIIVFSIITTRQSRRNSFHPAAHILRNRIFYSNLPSANAVPSPSHQDLYSLPSQPHPIQQHVSSSCVSSLSFVYVIPSSSSSPSTIPLLLCTYYLQCPVSDLRVIMHCSFVHAMGSPSILYLVSSFGNCGSVSFRLCVRCTYIASLSIQS